ncbi:fumarate reductase subunit FrdD [Vibrio sp.]|uniref:Fumarate reductase subunit D n=2 Tax=Vibrio viridaestus TaxID=2487322 RepID=A0A3N9TAX8_9VIBR|nr:fumarate reductase subunit FrdD [Vibrio viridaestus]MDC0610103.1 fumarate reductase subunit FrdD [Vibrio sp.]RQW61301.1 fumarate reductase subunit FrdD [Vibrio viridaestus]
MINQHPKRSDEPVWWGLFGAGGTWFAMISPVTILVLGILGPLGIIDADAFSYERAAHFATNFIGAIFVILTLALPMWHAMHRVHHGMHDLKLHTGAAGKIICYGIAGVVTALGVIFVFMI